MSLLARSKGGRVRSWQLRLRRLAVFMHDLAWIPISLALAFLLRFGIYRPARLPEVRALAEFAVIAVVAHSLALWWRGCYRGLWRYSSLPDFVRLTQAVCVGVLLALAGAFLSNRLGGFPRSILLIYPFILLAGLVLGRGIYRVWKDHSFVVGFRGGTRAVVVGAGRAGELLIRDLRRDGRYVAVALVDDDPAKLGREIHGVRIAGRLSDLATVVHDSAAEAVLFAVPTAPGSVLQGVVETCKNLRVPCRTLPSLSELVDGRVSAQSLRPVAVEDLLGRDPVRLRSSRVTAWMQGRRVLVTGGGGSIGSELCRQALQAGAAKLLVVDNCEYNLYRTLMKLEKVWPESVAGRLLDVTDAEGVASVFAQFRPDYVFHAAAYKHVPLVEMNPEAGIRVNTVGTRITAEAACRYGTSRFVFVSTDKAVAPSNVMGATKRISERLCERMNAVSQCEFVVTRFGNVLGSTGSVVPLFRSQIDAGGPITVTHPEVKRFFMTIAEAVSLILEAGASKLKGGVFVLDMGKPMLIRDLAEQMIRLSGLEPGREVEIVYCGLRPGEKLHEELFYPEEQRLGTDHPKLMLAKRIAEEDDRAFEEGWKSLMSALGRGDRACIYAALKSLVPAFDPTLICSEAPHDVATKPRLAAVGGRKNTDAQQAGVPVVNVGPGPEGY